MKAKRRVRKKPPRLSEAEIAEIDGLMELHHNLLDGLLCASPTTPWPQRPILGHDGFFYARENGLPERWRERLVEIGRRDDGVIRYALAPGEPAFDPDWSKVDPSWQFILTRTRGVLPNNLDRAIKVVIKEFLLTTNTPLGPYTRAYLDGCVELDPDPKRREHQQDRTLANAIAGHLGLVVEVLRAAGFKDAKTRAAKYLARRWRKLEPGRFSSGGALTAWLYRHR